MVHRAAVAIGFTAVAAAVSLQRPTSAIVLKPADAFLSEPFGSIHSIRELADGRVLISDASSENRLVVADLRTGRVRLVGNNGAGPGEYRQAGALFRLPGDSTLFVDAPARGRWWLLLKGDSIVRNVPPDLPALNIIGTLQGVDSTGRVLGVRQAGAVRLSSSTNQRSLLAVVADRNGARADTVTHLRGSDGHITQTGTRDRPFWIERQLMGSAPDQATLFPDGWIAVVRVEPYRVEWTSRGGTSIRGPEIPWERPRSDAREKAAAFEREKRWNPDAKQGDTPWADRLAPISSRALVPTPEGNLLVLRAQWSRAMETNYDVFDRTGARIATMQLPDSERVVGFGSRSVYVSVRDGDGIVRLRRHPWP